MFLLLSLTGWSFRVLAQGSSEVRFQQLCRNFVDENSSSAKLELLEFSQGNPQSPLAALGYYLIGTQDLQNGRLESARDALKRALVGAEQVSISDFILYHHAKVLHKLNQPTLAIEGWRTYLRRFPRGHLARQAISFLWQDALLAGTPHLIFQAQQDWPHLSKSAEALYYAAAAHESIGEIRRSIDRYLRLHFRFPLSPLSPKVLNAITRLQVDYPPEFFEVPPSWRRVRAEKLFKGKRYRQAVEALNAALEETSFTGRKGQASVAPGYFRIPLREPTGISPDTPGLAPKIRAAASSLVLPG